MTGESQPAGPAAARGQRHRLEREVGPLPSAPARRGPARWAGPAAAPPRRSSSTSTPGAATATRRRPAGRRGRGRRATAQRGDDDADRRAARTSPHDGAGRWIGQQVDVVEHHRQGPGPDRARRDRARRSRRPHAPGHDAPGPQRRAPRRAARRRGRPAAVRPRSRQPARPAAPGGAPERIKTGMPSARARSASGPSGHSTTRGSPAYAAMTSGRRRSAPPQACEYVANRIGAPGRDVVPARGRRDGPGIRADATTGVVSGSRVAEELGPGRSAAERRQGPAPGGARAHARSSDRTAGPGVHPCRPRCIATAR